MRGRQGCNLPTNREKGELLLAARYGHTPEYNEHKKSDIGAWTQRRGRLSFTGRNPFKSQMSLPILNTFCREIASLGGFRTILGVPLLREGVPIGIFDLHRAAVRPFTEKQIKLVETFADQAVIAIENTRLFEAEQKRTRELTEMLEQQTATSEVLQVISSVPGRTQ